MAASRSFWVVILWEIAKGIVTNKKAAKSDDNGSDPLLKEGVTRPAGLNLMNRFHLLLY